METASSFETLVMIYQTGITSQKTAMFSIISSSSLSSADIFTRRGPTQISARIAFQNLP
jgi:hypothetical protein